MSLIPNLDTLTDEEKLKVLESVQKSIRESKEIQRKKIGENVQAVVAALKKIENDVSSRFDAVASKLENRISNIKDGRDGAPGIDGRPGRDGKDGRPGRDGKDGKDGAPGRDGIDGRDGISVANAYLDFDNSLVIELSDGRQINAGEVLPPDIAEKLKVIVNTSTGGVGLPEQTGNAGKYLYTDGTNLSWQTSGGGGGGTGDVIGPSSATDNAIARFNTTTGKLIQNSVVTISDSGDVAGGTSIQFSGSVPVTPPIGTLWFDSSTDTLNLRQNAITQQIGEEIFVYGKASSTISGQTILQAIYKTGSVGSSGVITFAPTVSGLTDSGLIIGVATEDIATNGFGRITSFGIVHGVNTTGSTYGETWADGDDIWYNPVTGGLTKTKPTAPNMRTRVGTVINAGSGGSGSFQVHLQLGTELGGTDSNVQFSSLSSGNIMIYDATAGYWKNANITAGTGITITNGAGSVTISSSGGGSGDGGAYAWFLS